MAKTLFPNGIPNSALTGRAKQIADQLDSSLFIKRAKPEHKDNQNVEAEEITWALEQIDQYDPETRDAVLKLAEALGVEAPNAAAVKREWQQRTTEKFDTPMQAMPMGDKAVLVDTSPDHQQPKLRVYDPKLDLWTTIELPDQYRTLGKNPGVAADAKGLYYSPGEWQFDQAIPRVLRYDVATRSWNEAPVNTALINGAAWASVGGNLYVAGGTDPKSSKPTTTTQLFDATQNKWVKGPDLPVARTGGRALEVDGKLVVVGGSAAPRIDVYDPKTGKWQDPPLHVGSPERQPSVWAEGGLLHVAGGGEVKNHEIVNLATGDISDGAPLPAGTTNTVATRVGDRIFAFGQELENGKRNRFTREWAVARPANGAGGDGAGGNGGVVNNTYNLQVVNVELNEVTENIKNFIDVTTTVHENVTVNDTRLSLAPIALVGLEARDEGKTCGFYDPDHDFYVRTKLDGQPLLKTGRDANGNRYLMGLAVGERSAVPHGQNDLFAYHAATRTLIPFKSDAKGQFAIPLPENVHGPLQIFSMKDGKASASASITV